MRQSFWQRMRGFDKRLWVLSAGWFINALGFSMVFPFLMRYLKTKRHFPEGKIGYIFLAMGLARIIGALVAGPLIDRIGRRRIMVAAPALRAVVFLVLAWAVHRWSPFWELTKLLTLASFMGSFFQTAADTYVADLVSPERRSDAYAVLRVGLNLGWMTGPAIGAFLARTPFSLLFAVTAGTGFVLASLAWAFCHETVEIAEHTGAEGRPPMGLSVLLTRPAFLVFCGMTLLLFMGSAQLVSTMAAYTGDLGISQKGLALLYTLNGLLVVLFQMPVNAALVRVRLNARLAVGGLVYALGYGAMGAASSLGHMAACVSLVSLAEMLVMPSSIAIATRFAPPEAKGRFVGVFSMTRSMGFSLGPFMGCQLYERFAGAGAPYLVWAVLPWITVLGAVGLFAMKDPAMAVTEGPETVKGGDSEKD